MSDNAYVFARYTGMFHIETFDGNMKRLDERTFIGTYDEAIEELKAEYEEFFPSTGLYLVYGKDPNHRGVAFWRRLSYEIRNPCLPGVQVIGQDKVKGIYRVYRMSRYGPMKWEGEEAADV